MEADGRMLFDLNVEQIVTKTLRLLETRRLVKSVKSISSKNKKLYMLFDLGETPLCNIVRQDV